MKITATSEAQSDHRSPPEAAPLPRGAWIVLTVLLAVYLVNNIDRSIFGILAQPIKEELDLSDSQLGLLSGAVFTLPYMLVGFPLARLADRANRARILAACVTWWSVMTALCGLSVGFLQLCLFRMGVGTGEAGCIPTCHSLIADTFPPSHRTKALAIYGLGVPLGGLVGSVIGGVVLDHWGWRAAFYAVGVPGLLVALAVWKLIQEPPRGRFDPSAADQGRPGFIEVLKAILRNKAMRQTVFGLGAAGFVSAPVATFIGAYLVRKFALPYTQIALLMGLTWMLGSAISTLAGGLLVQRLARKDERQLLWLPALATAVSTPFYVAAFAQNRWEPLAALLLIATILNATYLAPCYSVIHNSMPSRARATSSVVTGFLMGLVGFAIGPIISGWLNDHVAEWIFSRGGAGDYGALCPGGHGFTGAPASLDAACRTALLDGTQWVMMGSVALMVWPAWHWYLGGRHLRRQGSFTSPLGSEPA